MSKIIYSVKNKTVLSNIKKKQIFYLLLQILYKWLPLFFLFLLFVERLLTIINDIENKGNLKMM